MIGMPDDFEPFTEVVARQGARENIIHVETAGEAELHAVGGFHDSYDMAERRIAEYKFVALPCRGVVHLLGLLLHRDAARLLVEHGHLTGPNGSLTVGGK